MKKNLFPLKIRKNECCGVHVLIILGGGEREIPEAY